MVEDKTFRCGIEMSSEAKDSIRQNKDPEVEVEDVARNSNRSQLFQNILKNV